MEHSEWLQKVSKGDSINASANKAGIQQRTLARQVDREHIDAESVIALAIAYGIHPVGALVETEYLDEKWANQIDPFLAVRKLTDEQILEEILRRMKLPGDHREFTTPVDELIEERGNVTPLPHTDVLAPLPDLENLDYVAQHDTDQPTNDEYAEHHNEP